MSTFHKSCLKSLKMVLIKTINDGFAVASKDNLIICDVVNQKDKIIKIPEPVLPENLTQGQVDVLKKEDRSITSLAFSKNGEYIVVSTENKQVVIFNKSFNVIKNFIVNRAASQVHFTSSNDILVADKTGDVYLYKLNNEKESPILLLGHLSVICDFLLTNCEKYIITCDRDEKIRVSRFPNAYNIMSFCLGHKEFVTTLKLVNNTLFSASGDGTVRLWNYLNGHQLGIINCNDYIKDDGLLESFSKEMDEEKVDVTSLPITDMQVYESQSVFVAVSIYNMKAIQLYSTDLGTYKTTFLKNIQQNSDIYCFALGKNLYVLSDSLFCYSLNDELDCKEINRFCELYLDNLKLIKNNTITTFYKRKFDNVQEYLERKKQRLESK